MPSADAVLLNGRAESRALALHRGLHYGDGVFRTCLIYSGQVIDLSGQISKLTSDATQLGLTFDAPGELQHEAAKLAAGQPRAVLKMLLLRAGEGRGFRPEGSAADRLLCRVAHRGHPAAAWERGVRVFRTGFRLAAQPALAGIKHLNRLEQVLASRHWPDGAGEGLVEDSEGRPVCGTRSNLFWVKGGALRTPSLSRCGVAGRTRDRILELAPGIRVAAGTWEELLAADEVFVTNSLIGIWPVAGIDGRTWAAPGNVTHELMARLDHPRLLDA